MAEIAAANGDGSDPSSTPGCCSSCNRPQPGPWQKLQTTAQRVRLRRGSPMAQRIPIQLHVANALQWLGTLYRNPADALKRHISNAIHEHLKAKLDGTAHDRCEVAFTLDRHQVTIEYPYGMSRMELESALH